MSKASASIVRAVCPKKSTGSTDAVRALPVPDWAVWGTEALEKVLAAWLRKRVFKGAAVGFLPDGIPWAHLDSAGTAGNEAAGAWGAVGAMPAGARLIVA